MWKQVKGDGKNKEEREGPKLIGYIKDILFKF
jgi:hypothetical protein